MSRRICFTAALCVCAAAGSASAQTVLNLDDVMARAREGPAPDAALARAGEEEATLLDAAARFAHNPTVDAQAGPRGSAGGRTLDLAIGVSQPLDNRALRLAGAQVTRASADRIRIEAETIRHRDVHDAAAVFLTALADRDRLRVLEDAEALARQLAETNARRFAIGDVSGIDVGLSNLELARAAAATSAARADLQQRLGHLRTLIRIPAGDAITLDGALPDGPLPAFDVLAASLATRPDLAAFDAELREAQGLLATARALGSPAVELRAAYQREAGDTIVSGGLAMTLPLFQRGQGAFAAATARASRVTRLRDAVHQAALSELRSAYDDYGARATIAGTFARDAEAALSDTLSLAGRSYDAGEMGLVDLLQVRQHAMDTRLSIVDRRLDAALARLKTEFLAGALR